MGGELCAAASACRVLGHLPIVYLLTRKLVHCIDSQDRLQAFLQELAEMEHLTIENRKFSADVPTLFDCRAMLRRYSGTLTSISNKISTYVPALSTSNACAYHAPGRATVPRAVDVQEMALRHRPRSQPTAIRNWSQSLGSACRAGQR